MSREFLPLSPVWSHGNGVLSQEDAALLETKLRLLDEHPNDPLSSHHWWLASGASVMHWMGFGFGRSSSCGAEVDTGDGNNFSEIWDWGLLVVERGELEGFRPYRQFAVCRACYLNWEAP